MEQESKYNLEHSDEALTNVHNPAVCKGQPCTIHNMTDHHMRGWPQHWRADRNMMERICPHGIGHPDPDDNTEDTVHGCDGCCTPETHLTIYKYYLQGPKTVIDLPESFLVIHVGEQERQVTIWVELDPDAPKIPYTFQIVGTGGSVKGHQTHVGTAIVDPFVWHVYLEWNEDDDD